MHCFQFLSTLIVAFDLASAAPAKSEWELASLFPRKTGDFCNALEGNGSCQATSDCKGISYPTGLCPDDPADVQCCVELTCEADMSSGYCRSITNNGCSNGKFYAGHCPGDSDIQCCINSSDTPTSSDTNLWPACQKKLSCTFAQIQGSSMSDRLAYVRYMQSNFFVTLDAGDQFRAIEGVISFFIQETLGKPDSWISFVDTGIVQAIQNGGANALGIHSATGGNPGTTKWADFFRRMNAGGYSERDAHDEAWSIAEETSTGFGKDKADAKTDASIREQLWYNSTQLFRWIMRNRTLTINAARVILLWKGDDFINWLTNITLSEPTVCFSKAVWDTVDPATSFIVGIKFFVKILPNLVKCFEAN